MTKISLVAFSRFMIFSFITYNIPPKHPPVKAL